MPELHISLAAARINAEMTQGEVAKALGVTKQTIINWEKGRTIPRAMQLDCISRLYGISLDCIRLPCKYTLSGLILKTSDHETGHNDTQRKIAPAQPETTAAEHNEQEV